MKNIKQQNQIFYSHQSKQAKQESKIKHFFQNSLNFQSYPVKERTDSVKFQQNDQIILAWQNTIEKKLKIKSEYLKFAYLFFLALIGFGLFTDNYLFSILIILTGVILYMFEKEEPQIFLFGVTPEGVFAQDTLYEFDSLESFWIFYEKNGKKELSLKSKKSFLPYIKIPLGKVDPVLLRRILINFLPEKKHPLGFLDSIEEII